METALHSVGNQIAALAVLVCGGLAQEPSSRDALGSGGRIPVLLVSGSDTYHDWRRTTPQLRGVLEQSGRFDVRVAEDVHILESRDALKAYPVVIFNQQTPVSTAAIRTALAEYVRSGGGLVALHWAVDNFSDWPEFADLLGRAWQEGISAEEHGQFQVRILDREHAITRGIPDFHTAAGEAVHYRLRGTAAIHVLATARTESDPDIPVMFTNMPGRGRVFFTSFGHSAATRQSPALQQVLLRAVAWAAHRE